MSDKYKVFQGDEVYFVTFTIIDWIKVLEDDSYKLVLVDSIKYCQNNKGLQVFGYCIMPNHVHMIIQSNGESLITGILRDLKSFTAKAIIKKLIEDKPHDYDEILNKFSEAESKLKRIKNYKVWQDGNMAKIVYSNWFMLEKLNYIHNNPVEYDLCEKPWDYPFSSATNYCEMPSLIEVIILSIK